MMNMTRIVFIEKKVGEEFNWTIENEEVPKTGDNVITYTIVSVVSLVTLVASYRYLKKSKKGF